MESVQQEVEKFLGVMLFRPGKLLPVNTNVSLSEKLVNNALTKKDAELTLNAYGESDVWPSCHISCRMAANAWVMCPLVPRVLIILTALFHRPSKVCDWSKYQKEVDDIPVKNLVKGTVALRH